ncbi:DUF4422 domain-containing protein [Butyrivibrio sp. LC3010]|uniref:DUF4422 domain-containing protein n=1 Tax=Butyrivibrio sp. LC3010 TaxID=1280680 RepID=UPI00041506DD|nr:DUF4422 domain-containing protein [Butyrivibrio sp. LC3010]
MIDIKIIIATTKEYRVPDDPVYLPVEVGAALRDSRIQGYTADDTGDNISVKNGSYCELTGLYWAWKNLDADYIGLVHYRRYFGSPERDYDYEPFDRVIGGEELRQILKDKAILIPGKRKYYIETIKSHYAHTHYISQLDDTRRVIEKKYPGYLDSFDRVLNRVYGYMFNMMIMRRDLVDRYCSWMFSILPEVEELQKDNAYDAYQGRYIGRIGEILFNVWLDHELTEGTVSEDQITELPCVHIERINWIKKGWAFLAAKVFHMKYKHSF